MLASVFHDHSAKKGSTHECSATSETQETNISVWVCHFGQLKRARLLSYSTEGFDAVLDHVYCESAHARQVELRLGPLELPDT